MSASSTSLERIRDRLAGQHILVTGATGFLAKVFVEKLLRSVDTVGGIHLLIRASADGLSASDRAQRDILNTGAFDRLRAALGGSFKSLCDEKLHVVAGDLTRDRLGLSPEEYGRFARNIHVVVNSAATVTFDERLDWAVELNTRGPARLLQLAKDAGNIPFLQVSTCYVCGNRRGVVVEDFSAPESARESLPRDPQTGQFDLERILEILREEVETVLAQHGRDTENGRKALIEAGMRRARQFGWHDTYTFTKWLGEQLLVRQHGDVPLVIFRPAIIESSFEEPLPGWIDGLRMADPVIVAYGRGKLREFPGRPETVIDLIPVDFVANAMIAALPVGDSARRTPVVYQCASSERRPLVLGEMAEALETAFRHQPMSDDSGHPIVPPRLRFIPHERFLRRWERKHRRLLRHRGRLEALGRFRRRSRRLAAMARQLEQIIYFANIYAPYTHLDCRFADDELRRLAERLDPEDRRRFPFYADAIDWHDYLIHRHIPGVRANVLGAGIEPAGRLRGTPPAEEDGRATAWESLQGAHLFDVFRRSAERMGTKSALRIRRGGRWVCYSYEEALHATGSIMQRFLELGLRPRDRVVICGENGPEWGLTYLAAMRAGLTAVPLDPQWPPADVWAAARFVGAKLICSSAANPAALCTGRGEADPAVAAMTSPFVPAPGASRDRLPEPAYISDNDVASILFTSGTTLAPKAVPLTHGNLLANASALVRVHPIRSTDEFLSVLPLYHVFEFMGGFVVPLAAGATVTYVEQLKGPEILANMQATGTTIMLVVPRLLEMFLDSIERQVASAGRMTRTLFHLLGALSSLTGHRGARRLFGKVHQKFGGRLRMFVCGGSRLDPDVLRGFQRLGFSVYEGYGMTETSPVLTVTPPGRIKSGSVGPPLPNVELQVRDPGVEGIGEIWVRGPSVMAGYLDNDSATREAIVDGWLRTGDLGRVDADGYLHLTGRSKDLIITGAGKNVYPDELEDRYKDLPHVREFCILGIPSAQSAGDAIHAVVVIDPDSAPDLDRSSIEREIREAAARIGESLPTYQRIHAIHFWDRELPKTTTLKAKRGAIRALLLRATLDVGVNEDQRPVGGLRRTAAADSASARLPADAENGTLRHLRQIVAEASRRSPEEIRPDMHLLLDLGIDSIGKVDLLCALESRFGMEIDDETAGRVARVADLLAVVGDRKPREGRRLDPGRRRWWLGGRGIPALSNGRISVPALPLRWVLRGAGHLFMRSYVRVRASGCGHIPSAGPFILAPNHASHLDAPAVLRAVDGRRRIWVAAAEDYFFDTPVKRFVFGRVFDAIAFDRHVDGLQGLRRCGEALARGDGLLIFPEGTRSLTGRLQPFKVGTAALAVEHHAPIIPVYIHNSFDLCPKGRPLPQPGVVTVTFGPPIVPEPFDNETDHVRLYQSLTDRLQSAVAELAGSPGNKSD